ncbi:hypothetical protein IEO21_07500 [Rhodonia placenta]|uniref:BTB domain-containing protein n=1 Tax=Rhodonia placenta TaxID=104341 RepID=A0A8H7NYE3_9APHY|nr:hypothetical protein IEO21_07500 [Postia placenta]
MTDCQRDRTFYLENIFLRVEDTLYKVPKAHLENGSELFRQMFTLPVSEGCAADGTSDGTPLYLEGVAKTDFAAFLKAMFPRYALTSLEEDLFLAVDEWVAVLKLSEMWGFTDLRKVAIKRLSNMRLDPVFKVSLAMTYHIPRWFIPGLVGIARRESSLEPKEAELLGWDCALKIAEVRGSFPPAARCGCRCNVGHLILHRPLCPHHAVERFRHDFMPKILAVFGPVSAYV